MRAYRACALVLVLVCCALAQAAPQTTAFTYQGSLEQAGAPYTGLADFSFRLWDDELAGVQVAPQIAVPGVAVYNGVFTVELDFGAPFGTQQRWLEIEVGGETLTPRQPVTPAPMALYALSGLPGPAGLGYLAYGGTAQSSPWQDPAASASYASLLGTSGVQPSEARVGALVPAACTMRDLRVVFVTNDPAYVATSIALMRNGAATSLTCAVVLGGVGSGSCNDLGNTVALAAGDRLSLRISPALPAVALSNSEAEQPVYINFGLRCVGSP